MLKSDVAPVTDNRNKHEISRLNELRRKKNSPTAGGLKTGHRSRRNISSFLCPVLTLNNPDKLQTLMEMN